MTPESKDELPPPSWEQSVQREELSLFQALLEILRGAMRSRNAVEREAALRLSTKLKRCICASGSRLDRP